MGKILFMFPGQGSQFIGMGEDFYKKYKFVREIFKFASDISKKDIAKLCFKSPIGELSKTVNLQLAVTVVNIASFEVLRRNGIEPECCMGHSLGEFSALYACGVLTIEDTFKTVIRRGELMQRETEKCPGVMYAVIGLDIREVSKTVEEASRLGKLNIANYNTERQIVISGEETPVKEALRLAKKRGVGKVVRLNVSGSWHSELLLEAVAAFRSFLKTIPLTSPKKKLIMNTSAAYETDLEQIKSNIMKQFYSTVLWYDSMKVAIKDGYNKFIEVGPNKILKGMLRYINRDLNSYEVYNVGDEKSLRFLVATFNKN